MMILFVITFSSSQKKTTKTTKKGERNRHLEGSDSAFEMLIGFYVITVWEMEVHHDAVIALGG